jgi:spore coat polysaccharide biosynthesis protein SpsF (cytidylyltransferase family)
VIQAGLPVAVLIPFNDPLKQYLYSANILCLEGPEDDVLARFYTAATMLKTNYIVRITADCPMIDIATLAYMSADAVRKQVDFMTNLPCPDGYDIEIVSYRALRWAHEKAVALPDREHVTTFIKAHLPEFARSGMNHGRYKSPFLLSWFPKLSIDTPEDMEAIRGIYERVKNA